MVHITNATTVHVINLLHIGTTAFLLAAPTKYIPTSCSLPRIYHIILLLLLLLLCIIIIIIVIIHVLLCDARIEIIGDHSVCQNIVVIRIINADIGCILLYSISETVHCIRIFIGVIVISLRFSRLELLINKRSQIICTLSSAISKRRLYTSVLYSI